MEFEVELTLIIPSSASSRGKLLSHTARLAMGFDDWSWRYFLALYLWC